MVQTWQFTSLTFWNVYCFNSKKFRVPPTWLKLCPTKEPERTSQEPRQTQALLQAWDSNGLEGKGHALSTCKSGNAPGWENTRFALSAPHWFPLIMFNRMNSVGSATSAWVWVLGLSFTKCMTSGKVLPSVFLSSGANGKTSNNAFFWWVNGILCEVFEMEANM